MMSDGCSYPMCQVCNKGFLLPVEMGSGDDNEVRYRCTNPECGVRFDRHGYERYDNSTQEWIRV